MKMCNAFAKRGHEVCLVSKLTPSRQENSDGDDYTFYGVAHNFEIVKLDRPANFGGGVVYAKRIDEILRQRGKEFDLIFSRDLSGGWRATRLGLPTVFDAHGMPANMTARFLWRRMVGSQHLKRLTTNCAALRDELERQGLIPRSLQVCVAHNGTDIPIEPRTTNSVPDLTLLEGKPHLGYVGQLWRGKGMELVAALAVRMPESLFHVVGGNDSDVQMWKDSNPPQNLVLHGFVPPGLLRDFYRFFDILLMPYQKQVYGATGNEEISKWMSPLKMFEYMATGKPIVSSNHAVLQEVLHDEENALLVPPDDVEAWAKAVRRILVEPGLGKRLGEKARRQLIEHYTWDARAQKVLDGIGEKIAA